MISYDTALDIAKAHQEITRAEALLKEVQESLQNRKEPDVRDGFGRRQTGLQLGVPTGENSHRLYMVDWSLCVPVLRAHIGQMRAKLDALNALAMTEAGKHVQEDDGA